MNNWQIYSLDELADIRISNVDKKSKHGENSVLLCNYMDVYPNDYVTANLAFMESTASFVEYTRFKVDRGDVLITKDSETPYDIGIPSVVIDEIEDLVCGYHLALIKPYKGIVNSVFLSKQLATAAVSSYFSRMAAGSTRYGLSNGAIARTKIAIPSLNKQHKIAKILQTIDRAITHTEALIEKYQQIKAGLMHDLFTRGIGADGKLRPPRDQAPEMYRESSIGWIPKEWQLELLDRLAQRGSGHTPNKNIGGYWNGNIKWVSLADSRKLDKLYIFDTDLEISELGIQNSSANIHPSGTVIMTRDAGVGKSAIISEPMAVSQHFMAWRCAEKMNNYFLYYWLQYKKQMFENVAMGSTIVTIGLPYFKRLKISAPTSIIEQAIISEKLKSTDMHIFSLKSELEKLKYKKSGLMHDLLTGKVQVNSEEIT
jgi:type I restriction enzyme, S subunit